MPDAVGMKKPGQPKKPSGPGERRLVHPEVESPDSIRRVDLHQVSLAAFPLAGHFHEPDERIAQNGMLGADNDMSGVPKAFAQIIDRDTPFALGRDVSALLGVLDGVNRNEFLIVILHGKRGSFQ